MKGFLRRVKAIKKKSGKQRMKRTSNTKIFSIVKEKRSPAPKSDHNDFSTTQSELTEDSLPTQSGSLFDFVIPSFFNDFRPNLEIQTKLLQYDRLNYMFDDIEDRDIYLVRKDSLFC